MALLVRVECEADPRVALTVQANNDCVRVALFSVVPKDGVRRRDHEADQLRLADSEDRDPDLLDIVRLPKGTRDKECDIEPLCVGDVDGERECVAENDTESDNDGSVALTFNVTDSVRDLDLDAVRLALCDTDIDIAAVAECDRPHA